MNRVTLIVAGLVGLATGYLISEQGLFNDGSAESSPIVFQPAMTIGDRTLPFSEAVRVGSMLYLAGQIGIPPGGSELVAGGIAAETRQTMDNIRRVVEKHGSSMDRIVKCTVFLADMNEWQAMNEIYIGYFPDHPPARSALGVVGLALGARTEIECLAVAGD